MYPPREALSMHVNVFWIVVSSVVGGVVLVGGFVYLLLRAILAIAQKQRDVLANEGIVLDSGSVWMTIQYRGFSAPRFARGIGFDKRKGAFILTKNRFSVVPRRWQHEQIARSDLGRFTVGTDAEGRLLVRSDNPPNASGLIEFHVPVGDPNAWISALTAAGARSA